MVEFEKPTNNEVKRHVLETTKHCFHVEYYLNELGLTNNDFETLHDLTGDYNKFEWEILRGLSLTYRKASKDFFNEQILPSIELHRNQPHHKMYNEPNPSATIDHSIEGTVDVSCSMTEKRKMSGGKEQRQMGKAHSWDEIEDFFDSLEPKYQYKKDAAKIIIPEMKKIVSPNLESIVSLNNIPNVGVPKETYQLIKERVREVEIDLKFRGYNILG